MQAIEPLGPFFQRSGRADERCDIDATLLDLASGPDPDDVICGRLDISAASADLGWQPKIDLPNGVDRMIVELSARP